MAETNGKEIPWMPSTPTKDNKNFADMIGEKLQVNQLGLNIRVEGDDDMCNMEEDFGSLVVDGYENLDAFRPGEVSTASKVTQLENKEKQVDTSPNCSIRKRKRLQQVPKIRKHRPKVVRDKLMDDVAPRSPKCITPKKKNYVKGKRFNEKKLEPTCKKVLDFENGEGKLGEQIQQPKLKSELLKYISSLQVIPRKFRSKSRYMSRVLGRFRGIILQLRLQPKKKRSKTMLGCSRVTMNCFHHITPQDSQIQGIDPEPSHHPQALAEIECAAKESYIYQPFVETNQSVENFLVEAYGRLGLTIHACIRKKVRKKAWTKSEKLKLELLIHDPMRETVDNNAIVLHVDSFSQIKEQARGREKLKQQLWENERILFRGRVELFINCMRLIQGNRKFKSWKGSVIDSIVGVFLTQNVSDYLSSNAFMCVAARYPPPRSERKYNVSFEDIYDDQEIGGSCIDEVMKEFEDFNDSDEDVYDEQESSVTNSTEKKESKEKIPHKDANIFVWDSLRKMYGKQKLERDCDAMDSVDWDVVRRAPLKEFANTIIHRGQHVQIGRRIQNFLNRVVEEHRSLDLEWLKDVPPEKVKEYLLSISGIGLKSMECIRLLALRQVAFPVDVNVQRIVVRLGWVPLQPLPGGVEIHVLEQYPMLEHIQKYLWPRLCSLDHETLYELHYHMITFGKIFCKKKNPNCDACPFKGQCKHYANEVARKNALPGPEESKAPSDIDISSVISMIQNVSSYASFPTDTSLDPCKHPVTECSPLQLYTPLATQYPTRALESILELPTMEQVLEFPVNEHIIEMPVSPPPRPSYTVTAEMDIEDLCKENSKEIIEFQPQKMTGEELENGLMFRKIALSSARMFGPSPQLKVVSKHKTDHYVYELPDFHPILARHNFERRDWNDVNPYLLAIWDPCETPSAASQDKQPLALCNSPWEQSSQLLHGTILIPCRTAMKGFFPLNGTYFQINEVFADHESSRSPIEVHRSELRNLQRRIVSCGTSPSAVSKGLSMEEIMRFFLTGFICIRAFDRNTRAPHRLADWLHSYTTAADRAQRRQQKEIEKKQSEIKSKVEANVNACQ